VGEDEAPNTVLHYGFAFPRAGSNMPIACDGEPAFNPNSPQPYRVIGSRQKDVVLENDILAHLLEFIGHGTR
jgi:hypothetical protein